jgi:hydrogenase maturation factor HypE
MATVKQLETLFSKLGIAAEQRHERINAWTAGRTRSAKELDKEELEELCQSLASDVKSTKLELENALRKKRSIVLKIATEQGIKSPNDFDSFNHFMLHSSVVKKSLNLCDLVELDAVIIQFRGIETNNNRSAQKAGTKAYFQQFGLPKISKN